MPGHYLYMEYNGRAVDDRLTNARALLFVGTPGDGLDYIRYIRCDVEGGDSTLRILGEGLRGEVGATGGDSTLRILGEGLRGEVGATGGDCTLRILGEGLRGEVGATGGDSTLCIFGEGRPLIVQIHGVEQAVIACNRTVHIDRSHLVSLLVMFGLAIVLQNAMKLIFTADFRRTVTALEGSWRISDGLTVPVTKFWILIMALGVLGCLSAFLHRPGSARASEPRRRTAKPLSSWAWMCAGCTRSP